MSDLKHLECLTQLRELDIGGSFFDRRGARSSCRPEATAKDRHPEHRHHAAGQAEAPRGAAELKFDGESQQ